MPLGAEQLFSRGFLSPRERVGTRGLEGEGDRDQWELRDEKPHRYRCRLGHAFTAESLLAGQSEVIE